MASMSINGVVSGIDWESMIDKIITAAAKPAQVQVNKRTNLQNKKSLFEEMKVMVQSIQTSMTSLKLPSTYKAKEIEIENMDGGSYKKVLTATVNADAEVNVHTVNVKQIATAQTVRSFSMTGSTISSYVGGQDKTMYINAGGQKVAIDVKASDTLQTLKSRINNTLKTLDNPIAVTASVVDNKLVLKSDSTGRGTKTIEGTVKGGYNSSGVTSLKGIVTNSETGATADIIVDDPKSLKITSGSKSYSVEKGDFDVVNKNEIRWKQYEDTDNEIKLGESVNTIKYTTTSGDIYSVTGTAGDTEATLKISGWNDDDGLLKSRLKITDANGDDYTYGTDFTINDEGQVEWITSKTVSNEPSSFTLKYTKNMGTSSFTESGNTKAAKADNSTFNSLSALIALDGVSAIDSSITFTNNNNEAQNVQFVKFAIPSEAQLTDGTTSYEYGRDYVFRSSTNKDTTDAIFLVNKTDNSSTTTYVSDYQTKAKYTPSGTALDIALATIAETSKLTFTYKHTYEEPSTNSSGITTLLSSASDDYDNLYIVDSDNNTSAITLEDDLSTLGDYEFAIIDGEIRWRESVETAHYPADDTEYTLTYRSGGSLSTTGNTINSTSNPNLYQADGTSVKASSSTCCFAFIQDGNSGNMTLSGHSDCLSYEQIISDLQDLGELGDTYTGAELTEALSKYFNVTNEDGSVTYEYGKDYIINRGGKSSTKTGVSSNERLPTIRWITGGNIPSTGSSVKISYGGRGTGGGETIELDNAITRSAQDTITSSEATLPSYGSFITADSVRISDGVNAYYQGVDFTIDIDAYSFDKNGNIILDANNNPVGNAVINWNTQSQGTPKYLTWFGSSKEFFDSPTSTTVTDSDGFEITGYTISVDDDSGDVTFKMNNDSVLAEGKYNITVVKDGLTKTFTLTSDGDETMKISVPDDAPSITVTSSDGTEITDYTISADSSGNAVFALTDVTTLAAGDYEIKVVKNGTTRIFDLTSNGTTTSITQRSAWQSQDNTEKGSYEIVVTNGGTTTTYTGTRPAGSYSFSIDDNTSPNYSDFDDGTVTITQGSKTFYQDIDFTIEKDDDGKAVVQWITDDDGGYEWYYPNSSRNSTYTINLTKSDGTTKTYSGTRNYQETLDMSDFGFTSYKGSISIKTGEDDDGNNVYVSIDDDDANSELQDEYSFNVTTGTSSGNTIFNFNWLTPSRTTKSNMPSYGDELNISYEYDANTFTLSDDSNDGQSGVLDDLGLSNKNWFNSDDTENTTFYTGAHNAIFELDGEEIERDTNDIGESYGNEIEDLKGVTLHLKGIGEVSLDIAHDAEKAVETIQTFVDNYNSLMSWMNTRMTEKQVDEDTAATIDSDDFRMRWGLLHGNSLLRQTKSQMRSIMSQNFTYSFTQRTSAEEIYGTMAHNGLKNDATLRLRIGSVFSDLTISPTNTLQEIVDMINDSTNPAMRNIYYDEDGNLRDQPLLKASIVDDKFVINSTSNDTISLSGTSALNALKMNYTYTGLFQIGISTTSTDYGKSGELEFDTSTFMEALEDNPDEVQELALMFANSMDTWLKSMLTTSASGETSGTLTRQIEDIDTQIASIDEYLEKYQDRLDRQEESLRSKFTAAEEQIAKLSQQANSIASILNMMNGNTSSSNSYTAST